MTELAPSIEAACLRWADRPAVTFRGSTITYGQFWEEVLGLAGTYERLGVRPGDRIVCQLPNRPEHVVAIAAAWTCGAIHAGTDNDLTGPELASLVARTDAAALLFQPRGEGAASWEAARAVREVAPSTAVLAADAPSDGVGDGTLSLSAALRNDPPDHPAPLRAQDIALLLLTSGTTGKPKAVRENLANGWGKMQFFASAYCPGPGDVHLVFLPMGHVFGLRLALIALLTGGRLVLLDRFSPAEALRLVTDEGVTVLPGMPTHFRLMIDRLDPAAHRVDTLRWAISAAASFPRPLVEQVYERLGVDILYVYGCSEGFTTQTTDRELILRGSVGRQVYVGPPATPPAGTVRVVDPADRSPLRPGEVGEVAFGARFPVQYWDDPDVATDGWYYTGDLGRIDDDGCVYLLGRLKELVNRGGLKVAPTEIEAAVARHPGVADAAVVGTPDPVLEEAICACVVPADGNAPGLDELREFLGGTLARHKLPDELCVVQSIPRTKIGKVDRAALVRLLADQDLPRERLRRN